MIRSTLPRLITGPLNSKARKQIEKIHQQVLNCRAVRIFFMAMEAAQKEHESPALGLDVIATDYGGNIDFCTGPLSHPIDYKLIPVKPGEYPHHKGMMWAEPNLQQAVAVMREVARICYNSPTPDPEVVAEYRRRFSAETVGARYRERLVELWHSRLQIQKMIDMSHEIGTDDSTANSYRWQR